MKRAFTLLELLVAIAVVTVLVGVVLAIGYALGDRTDHQRTRDTIDILDTAMSEFIGENGAPTFGIDGEPTIAYHFQFQMDLHHLELTRQIIARLMRSDDGRAIIAAIPSARLKPKTTASGEQSADVIDAWGMPIIVVFPGRPFQPSDNGVYLRDADGTIRVPGGPAGMWASEVVYGACENKRPYFMSAGPDRQYGDLSGNPRLSLDNLYSYDPIIP